MSGANRAGLALVAAALALGGPAQGFEWEGESAGLSLITHARTYSLVLYDAGADERAETLRGLGLSDLSAVPGTEQQSAAVVERFRFVLEGWVGDAVSFEAHYDLIPIFGQFDTVGLFTAAENTLRLWDFDRELHTDDDWSVGHGVDRLVVRYLAESFEVRVGRQALGFGGSRLFNAADLFAPLGPASIDSEFKGGLDGVQVIVPVSERHELTAIAIGHRDDFADGMYLLQWRGMFDGFDAGALAGTSYGRPTIALSLAGDLGGTGWYVDASARIDLDEPADTPARASAGLDDQLADGLRGVLEVHYSGAGASDPADYLEAQSSDAFATAEVYLLGEYYAGALLSYQVHPLVNIGASWLQSLTDGSALAGPNLAWDFAQEVSLGLGALIPVGERLSISPVGLPEVNSEFGLYPVIVFTDVRLAL